MSIAVRHCAERGGGEGPLQNLVLPANCVMDREGYDYAPNRGDESFDDAEDDEYDVSEYGDERDYNKWRMAWTGADTGYL